MNSGKEYTVDRMELENDLEDEVEEYASKQPKFVEELETQDKLPKLTKFVLKVITLHVTAMEHEEGERSTVGHEAVGSLESRNEVLVDPLRPLDPAPKGAMRLESCRFLMGLSTIDALSWVVGKAMQFESLYVAEKVGQSYVQIALVLTTIEVVVEFFASSMSPYIYHKLQKADMFTSKNLAQAAFKAYGISSLVACVVYPVIGVLMYFVFEPSLTFLVVLIIIQAFQYSFFNQAGDALREMAQPHWLHTFQSYDVVFPGCHCGLRRPATSDSLALYLQLSFLVVSFFFGAIYTLFSEIDAARWGLAIGASYLNMAIVLVLYKSLDVLTKNVVDSIAVAEDEKNRLVIWLCSMKGFEIAFVVLMVTVIYIPEQAYNSILAVILLELGSIQKIAVAVLAAGAVLVFVVVQIVRMPRFLSVHCEDEVVANEGKSDYKYWMVFVAGVVSALGGGAVGLYLLDGTTGLLVSIASFVLVRPFMVLYQAKADSFLFLYPSQRASNIRLWVNICTVLVNGPILALNWWAVSGGLDSLGIETTTTSDDGETSPEEQKQAAVVLFLSITIMGLVFFYFVAVDPWACTPSASLNHAVRHAPKHAL